MTPDGTSNEHSLALLTVAEELQAEDELLLRSAPLMRRYARDLCEHNRSVSSKTCESYHGWWQYWRLAGIESTPNWHAEFYKDFVAATLDQRERIALICGTADYGVLDHLVRAIPANLVASTRIAVVDLCRTPLKISSWYGNEYEKKYQRKLNLSLHRGDAMKLSFLDETLDLITTYAFLTRFPDYEKEIVVREWLRILKPGGRVITTARVASHGSRAAAGPDAEAFSAHVKQQIREHKPWLMPAIEIIGFLAFEYARGAVASHAVPSLDSLYELFGEFDCTVKCSVVEKRFGEAKSYARILAVKR